MDTQALLRELSARIGAGDISPEEVAHQLGLVAPEAAAPGAGQITKSSRFSVTSLLTYLGAGIIIFGVLVFTTQVWERIGASGRVAVTLGLGLLFAALGSTLLKNKPENNLGAVYHLIGGVLMPGGAIVALFEYGGDSVSLWPVAATFGLLFVFYLLLNAAHRGHAVLRLFAIANGTVCTYALVAALVHGSAQDHDELYAFLTMLLGASYLLLVHAFRYAWNSSLLGLLLFLGSTGFLGGAFWLVVDSLAWQLLYFAIVAGGLCVAVRMKSRIVLLVSKLFLGVHVAYITNEYFADSLGWALSLVLLGFLFIGLGYSSLAISKKYLKRAT